MAIVVKKIGLALGLSIGFVGSVVAGFDPGPGPGNISALTDVAFVSACYTFTDGNYARGVVDFTQGFTVSPNSTVTLNLSSSIPEDATVSFDTSSTIVLEQPLIFEGAARLNGTFRGSASAGGLAVIRASSITIRDNVFFPGMTIGGSPVGAWVDIDVFGGQIIRDGAAPWGAGIYVGDATNSGTMILRNAAMIVADALTSTWPVYRYQGVPWIHAVNTSNYANLVFYNCSLNILEQASFYNMSMNFNGDCAIQNTAPFDPLASFYNQRPLVVSSSGGAQKARFIVDSTVVGFNYEVLLTGPTSLIVGPDVAMSIGNLGLRQETAHSGTLPTVYPFGDILGAVNKSFQSYDCSMILYNSSLSLSKPCTLEGCVRLTVLGDCDLYSTATNADYRIFTIGRYASSQAGTLAIDSILDIQPSSVLNIHNMVLRNNNTP